MKLAETLVGVAIVLAFVLLFLIIRNIIVPPLDTYTGRIVKLWIQGESSYATLESADGQRQGFYLNPVDYGALEIGQECTFHANDVKKVAAATCKAVKAQ